MQASAAIETADHLQAAVAPARPLVLDPPAVAPHPGAQTPPVPPQTSLWKLVSPYAWTHRWALALCLCLNALPGFAMALQTLAPAYLFDHILNAQHLTMNVRYARLGLLLVCYLFVAIVLRMYAWYGSYKIFTRVRESIILELRARFFRHINGLCLRFHGKHSSGELFTYVMGTPLSEISTFYHTLAMNVPNSACMFLSALIMLGAWDWGMTLILLVSVVLTVPQQQQRPQQAARSDAGLPRHGKQGHRPGRRHLPGQPRREDVRHRRQDERHLLPDGQRVAPEGIRPRSQDPPGQHAPGSRGHFLFHSGLCRGGWPLHERPPLQRPVLHLHDGLRGAPGPGAAHVPVGHRQGPRPGQRQSAQRHADRRQHHARAAPPGPAAPRRRARRPAPDLRLHPRRARPQGHQPDHPLRPDRGLRRPERQRQKHAG